MESQDMLFQHIVGTKEPCDIQDQLKQSLSKEKCNHRLFLTSRVTEQTLSKGIQNTLGFEADEHGTIVRI